jgi:preprotein translocase subunit Sec63
MRFDIYSYYNEEIKSDDNTTVENSIRKNFKNLDLKAAKEKLNEFLDSVPENATNLYIEMHKSYEEQMDAALQSI